MPGDYDGDGETQIAAWRPRPAVVHHPVQLIRDSNHSVIGAWPGTFQCQATTTAMGRPISLFGGRRPGQKRHAVEQSVHLSDHSILGVAGRRSRARRLSGRWESGLRCSATVKRRLARDPVGQSRHLRSLSPGGRLGTFPCQATTMGTGKTDFAVRRPSRGQWFIIPSGTPGTPITQSWGSSGGHPSSG